MRVSATLIALSSVASGFLIPRQANDTTPGTPNVAAAQYDGYVPVPPPPHSSI
jgi:apolipoprotein D and lipocalin family protein